MQKAMKWIAGIGTALAAVLGFFLWRKYQKDHADSLADALTVAKAEKKVAELNGRRAEVEKRVDARQEDIKEVDQALDENKKAIVEARTGARGLSRGEVLAEYKRLGYL